MNIDLDRLLGLDAPRVTLRERVRELEVGTRIKHAVTRRIPRPHVRLHRPSAALVEDATLLAGLAAIAAGCGWIFPPAAPIIGGLFLVVLSLRAARAAASEPREPQLREEPTVIRQYGGDDDEDD